MAAQSLGNRRFRFNYGYALLAIHICYMAKVHYEFVSDLTQDNIAKTHLPPSENGQSEHEKQIFDGTNDEQVVRVSCDSSPCNGFFAYDGPNMDSKAAMDVLQKAVAEYNYGTERNNETHNTIGYSCQLKQITQVVL